AGRLAVLLALALLGAPAVAAAHDRDDDHGHRAERPAAVAERDDDDREDGEDRAEAQDDDDDDAEAERRHRGKRRGPRLDTFVFAGVYEGNGAVAVTGGNSRVRKNRLAGTTITFDFSAARMRVADANGDGARDAADLEAGARVVVQARLPRRVEAAATGVVVARTVVDRTDEDDDA
ncbi:MAG TPA: hypothetical protein VN213_16760, partial [Solirubrobacteraceae bacterium]|nr:hypothetical protein [Solirubrobacteraceae bacterium]